MFTVTVPCGSRVDDGFCGLLAGHDADHVPFVPGWYLMPAALHPLDLVWFGGGVPWPCPSCGRLFDSYMIGPAPGAALSRARLLTVYPCGCVRRLPPPRRDAP